jgi:hypothetical protein
MKKHKYTPEEKQFLKENAKGRSYAELAALFNERFGTGFTRAQIAMTAHRYGYFNGLQNYYHSYTPEEKQFLKENAKGRSYAELTALFNERFGTDLTRSQIASTAEHGGCDNGRHPHKYTPEEKQFLKENAKGRSYAELTALFNERFGTGFTRAQIGSTAQNYGCANGRSSRFIPGNVPKNKGKHPWNWVPVGSERITGDGYRQVKIREPNEWKSKHVLIWEAANGKVPDFHRVIFADRDLANISLENLILVSMEERFQMAVSGLISTNAELTKTGKLIADARILESGLRKKIPLGEVKKKITGIWEARE